METLTYLFEANCYLCIFYAFYRFALHPQTFYGLNRLYLFIAVALSFVLPLCQAGQLSILLSGQPQQVRYVLLERPAGSEPVTLVWNQAWTAATLVALYLVGAIMLTVKLILSFLRILQLRRKNQSHYDQGVQIVELQASKHAGFSFFNTLFISTGAQNRQTIIEHEMAHIRKKHSYDVIFFEFIRIIGWFNPIVHLLCRDLRLLHEYQADEQSTLGNSRYDYALFLIKNTYGMPDLQLTNHIFNQSILKRRINMLNKEKTDKRGRLRYLLAAPIGVMLLAVSTMAFKNAGYKKFDLAPENLAHEKILIQDTVKQIRISAPDRSGKRNFYISFKSDANGQPVSTEKRLIVLNGKTLRNTEIGGVVAASRIQTLNAAEATRQYGNAGQYGAVVITGREARVLGYPLPPPPAPLPPAHPGARTAKKPLAPPPPPAHPKTAGSEHDKNSVPPPPPRASRAAKKVAPPPPPVEPPPARKKTVSITFTGKPEVEAVTFNAEQASIMKPAQREVIVEGKELHAQTMVPAAPAPERLQAIRITGLGTVKTQNAVKLVIGQARKSAPEEITVTGFGPGGPGAKPAKPVLPRSQEELRSITVTGKPLHK
ncbi:M56 family metallopeptidase [Pedobacter sp. SYP-B3415]|uniref:M56 family metallopeptidase n=1 Tax=Pedobacter sp. SYP-B3415 TaxID=2496641 RepID=UPI00101C860A|nr:M56 family metallopeptidase [Pedobacter sp. SYP-B3415]